MTPPASPAPVTAFACYNGRVAPVFDAARHLRLVALSRGGVATVTEAELPDGPPERKAARLAELGVGALVCGAITRPLQELVEAYGIRVTPFVAGELEAVIGAWRVGGLADKAFAMPGCHGRRGRRRDRGACAAGAAPGVCVCPACGHRESHARGIPCATRRCPRCQAPMVRA